MVDGSAAYLYSSIPLRVRLQSGEIDLREAIRGYRPTRELRRPDEAWWWEVWRGGRRIDRKDALLYGRLYLPASTLEGLYLRRLSPTQLLRVACVSDSRLKNGGTVGVFFFSLSILFIVPFSFECQVFITKASR